MVMVAMLVVTIAYLRRQRKLLTACIAGVVIFLTGSWYVGEHFRFSGGVLVPLCDPGERAGGGDDRCRAERAMAPGPLGAGVV